MNRVHLVTIIPLLRPGLELEIFIIFSFSCENAEAGLQGCKSAFYSV